MRPLSAVLDAVTAGARTVPLISLRTGLSADLIRASLDHLIRLGHLDAGTLCGVCPGGKCDRGTVCHISLADSGRHRATTPRGTPVTRSI